MSGKEIVENGFVFDIKFTVAGVEVQVPEYPPGEFPASVPIESHKFWSGPAIDAAPAIALMITVSELLQPKWLTVHLNRFDPTPNPLTPETGLLADPALPEPDKRDQVPIPYNGVVPAIVAIAPQIF